MQDPGRELTRTVIIINELGLHARPAAMIAQLAQNAQFGVWVQKEGALERMDAASIIDILTLACAKGTALVFGINNPVDAGVLNEIVELIENGNLD
ncbi:MAG: HPr family phosphocarrier protein [Deltaproteobacteria bacterium]|nr:MAG: HPr family phosphocarrier protein [Deltaproteobacteria bacterium]